jgi:hypothetical protein
MERWREMSRPARLAVVIAGAVQISLSFAAWVDLARRPADQVRGTKRVWAAAILVNFVGPIAYFARGRRRSG